VVHQDAGSLWRILVEQGIFDATQGLNPEEILEW
jgi:hypothetical protein